MLKVPGSVELSNSMLHPPLLSKAGSTAMSSNTFPLGPQFFFFFGGGYFLKVISL